jgi:hypothetical protein
MKLKFLTSLLFVLTCMASAQAQIEKGSLLLGTGIGFEQVKGKGQMSSLSTSKTNTFIISPSAGVAVKENLVAGIRLDYMTTRERNVPITDYYDNTDIKNYGAGIFLRRYIPLISQLYVFGEGNVNISVIRENTAKGPQIEELKIRGWSTGIHITPGISYGIGKKFQIEGGFNSLLSITYSKSKSTYNNNYRTTLDKFAGGISQNNESMFFAGFRYILK